MEEETTGVMVDPAPTEAPPTEEVPADVEPEPTTEPVDETGVPLKNRLAEQQRKLAKQMTELEAQQSLVQSTFEEPPQEDAVRIVESIAERQIRKAMEPLLAKQFLQDHPDAIDLVEDIVNIRTHNPELRDVTKLELAYKIAKAEKQEELVRAAEERGRKETETKKQLASQAASQGTGKTTAPTTTMQEKIAAATSLEELQKLEQMLKG